MDTNLFDRAAKFAIDAHRGIERRGKGYPYIMHPMEAACIVASLTTDPEMLAAAILHDTVEDTEVTIEQIRQEFGDRVASLVFHETSPLPHGSPWRVRKQAQADLIASSPLDSKMVAMGDKLSNLRTIVSDYRQIGDDLWPRFHAPNGKTDVMWYYGILADALADLADTQPYKEYLELLNEVGK
ncbi:MAG: bifunctional (p)ppGpp synthetase/guanosine-3',5'-bis(diphosphate) 3'-pyrophosphohydrolase [Bacteroidales bacterium]|nr:bifunctional (p)ppGpp synthetase/guanosine-3',5'-bis(diphosphate) 3'-pyrophosphohydrolase [Bacteroidales bacterium]